MLLLLLLLLYIVPFVDGGGVHDFFHPRRSQVGVLFVRILEKRPLHRRVVSARAQKQRAEAKHLTVGIAVAGVWVVTPAAETFE